MTNTPNDTHNASSSPFIGQSIHNGARVVFAVYGGLLILCGVIGNVLLITVIFARFRRKRHVYNLFIVNLSLADILTLGYWLTFLVLDLILGYHPVVNETHCVVNGMVICTSSTVCGFSFDSYGACVLSLLGISLNRYLHVCHSQVYQRFFTSSHTIAISVGTWVASVLVALPPVLRIDAGVYCYSGQTHVCSFNRSSYSYAKSMVILFSTVPMVIIGYCNFAIFRFWKKSRRNLATSRGRLSRRGRGSVRKGGQVELAGGGESVTSVGTGQCESEPSNPVTGGGSSVYVSASDERQSDQLQSRIENSGCDCDGTVNESGSCSQVRPSSSENGGEDEERCCNAAVPTPDTEFYSQTQMDEDEGRSTDDENGCVDQRQVVSETVPISKEKLSSETKGTTAEKPELSVTATKPPSVLENPPSRSWTESLKKTPTTGTRHTPGTTTTRHRHRHRRLKMKSAREDAFVRSLFVIFLTTCLSFVPYVIIMIVSSSVAVSSEVAILGLLLLFSNNAVNWLVYGVMNPSFRKAYRECGRQLMGKCCQGQRE